MNTPFFAFFCLFLVRSGRAITASAISAPHWRRAPPPIATPDDDDQDEGMMCVRLLRNSIKRQKNEPTISQQVEEGRVRPLQSFETLATTAILTSDNNDGFLLEWRLDLSSSFFLVSSGGGSGSFEIETSAILDVGVAASASPCRCSFFPSCDLTTLLEKKAGGVKRMHLQKQICRAMVAVWCLCANTR